MTDHLCPCCSGPSGSVMTDPGVCCFECFHALSISTRHLLICGLHGKYIEKVKASDTGQAT